MTTIPPRTVPATPRSLPTAVRDGATVDKAVVEGALTTVVEERLGVDEARALMQDLLTSSKVTPAAREALTAFLAASAEPPSSSSLFDGVLARWRDRSPASRADAEQERALAANDRLSSAVSTASWLARANNSRSVLEAALGRIDPVLGASVTLESKYSLGLTGLAKLFPELEQAVATFEAAHEPATALMEAALQKLPPPPAFSTIVEALKGEAVLDLKGVQDLLRAATREATPPAKLAQVLASATCTEAAAAFLGGFLAARDDSSVVSRFQEALRSEWDARDWLAAFDRALGELDPALAALGHTGLLMSGHYPHLEQAGKQIDNLTKARGVENWSAAARTIVAEAIQREKSTEASRPSD
jgi:hypothetical protein